MSIIYYPSPDEERVRTVDLRHDKFGVPKFYCQHCGLALRVLRRDPTRYDRVTGQGNHLCECWCPVYFEDADPTQTLWERLKWKWQVKRHDHFTYDADRGVLIPYE